MLHRGPNKNDGFGKLVEEITEFKHPWKLGF